MSKEALGLWRMPALLIVLVVAALAAGAGTAQAHFGACIETVNPHGQTIPPAGSTTLPGPRGGMNEDGFYLLFIRDPEPGSTATINVYLTGTNILIGNFPAGTVIKYTQRGAGTPIVIKKIGSTNGQAGAVDYHILAPGDFDVAVTSNLGSRQTCLVPRPPK